MCWFMLHAVLIGSKHAFCCCEAAAAGFTTESETASDKHVLSGTRLEYSSNLPWSHVPAPAVLHPVLLAANTAACHFTQM